MFTAAEKITILVLAVILLPILFRVFRKKKKQRRVSRTEAAARNRRLEEKEMYEGDLEYSRDESVKRGYRISKDVHHINFKRPVYLNPKGQSHVDSLVQARLKSSNTVYNNALKNWVPLVKLNSDRDFKGATLKVYVERINGNISVVRDNTSLYNLKADLALYVGQLIIINLNRISGEIKINYIMKG